MPRLANFSDILGLFSLQQQIHSQSVSPVTTGSDQGGVYMKTPLEFWGNDQTMTVPFFDSTLPQEYITRPQSHAVDAVDLGLI